MRGRSWNQPGAAAPWWPDGLRLVVQLSQEPVALEEQQFFYWDWGLDPEVGERIRELMGTRME